MKISLKLRELLFGAAVAALILWSLPSIAVGPAAQGDDGFASGVQAYSVGNFPRAEKLLAAYLKENPHSMIRDIGLLWYGRSLLALHRVPEARGVADSMAVEFSKSPLTQKLRDEILGFEKTGRLTEEATARNSSRHEVRIESPPKREKTSNAASAQEVAKAENRKIERKTERSVTPTAAVRKNPALKKTPEIAPHSVHAVAKASAKRTTAKNEEAGRTTKRGVKSAVAESRRALAGKRVVPAKVQKPLPVRPAAKQNERSKGKPAASFSKPKPSGHREIERSEEKRKKGPVVSRERPRVERKARVSTARREPRRKPVERKEKSSPVAGATLQARSLRDPFRPLVVRSNDEGPAVLPPGKKGLIINRLEIRGIVKTDEGYIAVAQSGPNGAAIFLRVNDSLYDGDVEKIFSDHVVFKRFATDKFGKVYMEEVSKSITGPAGF